MQFTYHNMLLCNILILQRLCFNTKHPIVYNLYSYLRLIIKIPDSLMFTVCYYGVAKIYNSVARCYRYDVQ